MKRILRNLACVVCVMAAMCGSVINGRAYAADRTPEFRAVWVSSVFNLDFPSKKGLSNDELKREIDNIVDRAAALNLNALIVQVRPMSDALYSSTYFPWSETLTGYQGLAPAGNFDPLAYWIERGHAKGLEIHAWINPFRVTHTSAKITDVNKLAANNPARKNPSWTISYKDALYFDPGRPECRKLIADGVEEILKNYDVDGIHLDDYFYPGTDFPDDVTYRLYGQDMARDDWRRENINALIKLIQQTVREHKPEVSYGVSPTAIWQNASSTPIGSDTRGYESYKSAYADTRRWVKEGWLDYICPQIYWYAGYEIADYVKVFRWWESVCKGTGVNLYIGHAAYREAEGTAAWRGEIVRQLMFNESSTVSQGSVFFRMGNLYGTLGDQIGRYYATRGTASIPVSTLPVVTLPPVTVTPSIPVTTPPPVTTLPVIPLPTPASALPAIVTDKLTVAQPSGNVSITSGSGYTILGTSNPNKSLYINGQLVTGRMPEGFFSYYATLKKGENKFTFTQEGQAAVTRTITLKDAAITYPATMSATNLTNAYPTSDEMAGPGSVITLKCTAPAGASVTVKLNGVTVTLKQDNANLKSTASTTYAAAFSGSFTIPVGGAGEVTDLGRPVYSMSYNGKTASAAAQGSVKRIGADAPLRAEVTAPSAWLYPNATSTGGSAWQVLKGQRDRVLAVTSNGGWVRLACGGWVESSGVYLYTDNTNTQNVLAAGNYINGVNEDMITWKTSLYPTVHVNFDGKTVNVGLGLQKTAPGHNINPEVTMFNNIVVGTTSGAPGYTLTLRDGARLEGVYVDYSNGELRLHLKKRKALSDTGKPLAGFSFVVDAGHGQRDSGAIGPMGGVLAEKHINLANAQKLTARLRELGAVVTMVRNTDVFYTLQERTEISRAVNPDMFISVHANSMAETTDSSNVRGFSVWYRNPGSLPLAETLITQLHNINPRTTRRALTNQSNFYVCRPSWTPSVIIEVSFMCNIEDFSWMIKEQNQQSLANGIADAVLAYYRR